MIEVLIGLAGLGLGDYLDPANLNTEDDKHNVYGVLIANFRDIGETFYMNVVALSEFIKNTDRKSIPLSFFQDKGIKFLQEKKRTRYRYNFNLFNAAW